MMRRTALALAVCFAVLLSACGGAPSTAASSSAASIPVVSSSAPVPPASSSESAAASEPPAPTNAQANPLTGLARGEGFEPGMRPVAVMVDNTPEALPQSGLAAADVLVEMPVEGGATRLMALYADYRTVPRVGPVRSTADQFLQLALPLAAIPVHIGATPYAGNLLNLLSYKDVNGVYLGTAAFYFDTPRSQPKPDGKANEFCWFTDAGLIYTGMERQDVHTTATVPSLFSFTPTPAMGTDAYTVNVAYTAAATASFDYDEAAGLYHKNLAGAPHADEDGTRLSYQNLIFLFCTIGAKADDEHSLEFDMRGGSGVYYNGGTAIPILWRKGAPTAPLQLFTQDGAPLSVQTGKSYIGVLEATGEALRVTHVAKP